MEKKYLLIILDQDDCVLYVLVVASGHGMSETPNGERVRHGTRGSVIAWGIHAAALLEHPVIGRCLHQADYEGACGVSH